MIGERNSGFKKTVRFLDETPLSSRVITDETNKSGFFQKIINLVS